MSCVVRGEEDTPARTLFFLGIGNTGLFLYNIDESDGEAQSWAFFTKSDGKNVVLRHMGLSTNTKK